LHELFLNELAFSLAAVVLAQVLVVGCIVNVEAQSTNMKYDIEDGTGKFQVTMWTNADDSEYEKERAQQWTMGTYVQVIGSLRSFNQSRNLVAFDITTINDHNMISHHMLEAIYTHLRNTRKGEGGMPAANSGGGMQTNTASSPSGGNQGGGGMQNQGQAIKMEGEGEGSLTDRVSELFKAACNSEAGLSIVDCHGKLEGVTLDQVKQIVEHLSNEGHLYSTIDEDHFKSTA
jgi:replication factor A2